MRKICSGKKKKAVFKQILLPPFTILKLLHKVMHFWGGKKCFLQPQRVLYHNCAKKQEHCFPL